jgi:lysyl-tRNA synthetase class 2
MTLTGIPLIILAFGATGVVATVTVRGWSRFGRWRYAVRTGGVLLCQALVVAGIGLAVNRSEQFYPSWAALAGNVGAAAVQHGRTAGRLDGELAAGPVTWHPPGVSAWRLSAAPTVSVPPAYETSAGLSYPVVLELRYTGRTPAPGAVTVTLAVTARTTVAALASLPAALGRDVRVGAGGWAVVAPASLARLADGLAQSAPQRYGAVALVGAGRAGLKPVAASLIGRRMPDPWFARFTARGWAAAVAWASARTAAPLADPIELPRGDR